MTDLFANPFPANDPDRQEIWTMLVERDIDAFVSQDWDMVAGDFVVDAFFGIDCSKTDNPDHWKLGFATFDAYRDEWLRQAADSASHEYKDDLKTAIFTATSLREIEINGDMAIAHKKFDGVINRADGTKDTLNWQTLYHCRRHEGRWKIAGFNGYLPNPMGGSSP